MKPGLETAENEEALLIENRAISKILAAVCREMPGKRRLTYTVDEHSAVDGGSDCRAIFGIAFRAGERVVIALMK